MSATENDEIFTTWSDDLVESDITVVYLCGELDASTAPGFLTDIHRIVNRKRNVVMDAHLLSYIDSTGVAAILSTKNALDNEGKRLCLAGCHGLMSKILRLTRIDTHIHCYEDLDTAVAELKEVDH